MRILLDTQVVLWQLQGSRTVGPNAAEAITSANEVLFVTSDDRIADYDIGLIDAAS